MNSRLFRPNALVLLAAALLAAPCGAAPVPVNDTWTDDVATYQPSPPLEGYFVPRAVLEKNYQATLKDVLAAARPMTKEELHKYTTGGAVKPSDDYPLFAFENHRVNVFLWTGKRTHAEQQILPRVWDGEIWNAKGYGPSQADTVEHLFYHPAEEKRCYVMVTQLLGAAAPNQVRTDRVFFGKFPTPEAVVKEGLKTADAVVYLPPRYRETFEEPLDRLKGDITAGELREVPGIKRASYDTLVFLRREGKKWVLSSMYYVERATFLGRYDELRLSIPQVRNVLAKNEWLKEYVEPAPMRWRLARQAAEAPKDAGCTLRWTNPGAKQGDWLILELVAGKEKPLPLFRTPVRRAQTDGGGSLFGFVVRQGNKEEELTARGRFGEGSAEPVTSRSLGCDYHFIDCGAGVVKLALKPREFTWRAKVEGRCLEWAGMLDGRETATLASEPVTVDVK